MENFLFYLFSALTLLGALLLVVNRNAVNGAMFMIISLIGMAALFLMLEAYFLFILQILVYAGAVMVLFLFIVMLIDVDKAVAKPDAVTIVASIIGLALLVLGIVTLFAGDHATATALPTVQELPQTASAEYIPFGTSVRGYGYGLFTKYMLPFQVTGFLLLIAMIGVIVVSKKITASGNAEKEGPRA